MLRLDDDACNVQKIWGNDRISFGAEADLKEWELSERA
jgi:hypothetical protein